MPPGSELARADSTLYRTHSKGVQVGGVRT